MKVIFPKCDQNVRTFVGWDYFVGSIDHNKIYNFNLIEKNPEDGDEGCRTQEIDWIEKPSLEKLDIIEKEIIREFEKRF